VHNSLDVNDPVKAESLGTLRCVGGRVGVGLRVWRESAQRQRAREAKERSRWHVYALRAVRGRRRGANPVSTYT